MTDLHVRDVDPEVVAALKAMAARQGRSMSQVHRELLERALRPQRRSLAAHLMAMPEVGRDEDFERVDEPPRDVLD